MKQPVNTMVEQVNLGASVECLQSSFQVVEFYLKTAFFFLALQSEHQKGSERPAKRGSWWRHVHAPWVTECKPAL